MKKLYLLLSVLLGATLLVGAGCTQTSTTNTNESDGTMVEDTVMDETHDDDAMMEEEDGESEETSSEPVPFSELTSNILDGKDEIGEYRYTHEEGTCVEQGAPEVISYLMDEELGYFVIESGDGEYREDVATGLASNTIRFDEVPLTDGEADCQIQVSYGEDTGTYTCSIEDEEVCSSTVSGVGVPL